jgi:GrpB-like predicted nucleotidyltransferase (UPF0157 family)
MIKIQPYRNIWPEEFHQIAAELRLNLGDLALRIDHIGSTSVPGLAAKDVIDIQITVVELNEEIIARMVGLGYSVVEENGCDHHPPEWTGPDSDWEKLFFKPPVGQRRTNIHVRVAGRPNQRYPLLFRDYLRSHPASAGAYAELKRRLAENLADQRTYPDVKDPAVDLIYFAAEDWAKETGWQPGPSDV